MKFLYSGYTDTGTVRKVNQDSLVIKSTKAGKGTILLAAVCDGVGGLSRGEQASRKAVLELSSWFDYELSGIFHTSQPESLLYYRCRQLLENINQEIYQDGLRRGILSGTTLSMLLLWNGQYLVGHVGDSRIYQIGRQTRQITSDHSWVAREVALGHMSMEEAKKDQRRNIILKCIGAEPEVNPDIILGKVQKPSVFLLCTDGFWHEIKPWEWMGYFSPQRIQREEDLKNGLLSGVSVVKKRGETDNITVVGVKVEAFF